jgi:hypothetical protein
MPSTPVPAGLLADFFMTAIAIRWRVGVEAAVPLARRTQRAIIGWTTASTSPPGAKEQPTAGTIERERAA